MKNLVLVNLACMFLIFGSLSCSHVQTTGNNSNTVTVTQSPSYVRYYDSLGELYTDAAMVVVGTVDRVVNTIDLNLGHGFDESSTWVRTYTEYAFHVEQVLKGNQSDEIMIRQCTGDRIEGGPEVKGVTTTFVHSDDNIPFQPGERCLLFLGEPKPGKFVTLGGPQGRFAIISGVVFSMDTAFPDKDITRGFSTSGLYEQGFIEAVKSSVQAAPPE